MLFCFDNDGINEVTRFLTAVAVLLFVYFFLLQILAIWPFTIDDMYITLRYARHWASGVGLVWNIGEPPVEGYSNFSFVVLGRLALTLGLDPVTVLKSAGVIGLLLTCVAVFKLSRFWFVVRIALIPPAWLLTYKGQIIWSVGGLETTVYQALICFAVFFIFKGLGYRAYPEKMQPGSLLPFIIAGFLMALAGMSRPEAPALMLLMIVLVWFNRPRPINQIILFTGTIILCFAPYFLWRWHYYGRLFPNPVYCKGLADVMDLTLAKNYLQLAWPFILLAIPAVIWSKDRRHYFLWLPSVVYLILLLGADPVVAFANRLFLPAFVLLLPLTLQGIKILISWYLNRHDSVFDAMLYLSAFLIAFFFIPGMSLAEYRQFSQNPRAGERLRQQVVQWLQQHTNKDSHVVLADSGLIPYQSRHQFIDSYCLNNAAMTKDPSADMYHRLCHHVLFTQPEVIILTSLREKGQVIYTPTDACLASVLQSGNTYRLQVSFSAGDERSLYQYEIFTRLGS